MLGNYLPMDTEVLDIGQLAQEGCIVVEGPDGKPTFEKHFLDDDVIFWRIALAFLMDYQFVTFVFNMLPIITLDGADFFGSFFRLATTPVATGIFLICTSLTCILGLVVWQLVLPAIGIYNRWDDITVEPKWADDGVKLLLFSAMFIVMKMFGFLSPTFKLCSDTCKGNDGLRKYHVFQVPKYEMQQRQAAIPMYDNSRRQSKRYSRRSDNYDQYGVVHA